MTLTAIRAAGLIMAVAIPAAPLSAARNTSAYTSLDRAACHAEIALQGSSHGTGTRNCEGYEGIAVHIVERDRRTFISYGPTPASEPAAAQTLPAINHVGKRIEWRVDPAGRPFATIFRLHTDANGRKGSTLVITRLGPPGRICHIGYIDAVANSDANELARTIADRVARRFRCGEEMALQYGLTGDEVPERY